MAHLLGTYLFVLKMQRRCRSDVDVIEIKYDANIFDIRKDGRTHTCECKLYEKIATIMTVTKVRVLQDKSELG